MGFSAGDHRFDSVCLPCAPWVNWLARSQLKCPSGVFVLGARDMTLNLNLNGLRANQLTQGAQGRHTESNLWPPCTKARCSFLIGENEYCEAGNQTRSI